MRHLSVCICTYQRPERLGGLLRLIEKQNTDGRFTFSIVVVDNDRKESARQVVTEFWGSSPVAVKYCVEPQQNIAMARNCAVENATGEFLAFIDDDEEPEADWLLQLVDAADRYQADGVLGPVISRFETPPPDWIIRSKLFERPIPPTGTWLPWTETRCGNVLLKTEIFKDKANRFAIECGRGGEDVEFFRRIIGKGRRFVWSEEAAVYEGIPPERCRRSYLIKRALLRGRTPYNQEWPAVLKSVVAVPAYTLSLPVSFLFGHHVFMRFLIKECDHLGRILAKLRIDVVREKYVTR